jgi:hypothetical protein
VIRRNRENSGFAATTPEKLDTATTLYLQATAERKIASWRK